MQKKTEKKQKSPQTVREIGFLGQLKQDLSVVGNVRVLCLCAMLAAMSLILEKFLQIPNPFQEIIRISFGNLPLILFGGFLVVGMVLKILDVWMPRWFIAVFMVALVVSAAYSIGLHREITEYIDEHIPQEDEPEP
jgi:uncharacterized membrane protein